MTNNEFIEKVCEYYKESRKLTIDSTSHNIWRGVNHSISGKSEDLFAFFIANKLNNASLEFIVDKTMTYKIPDEKPIQFRPDLAIVQNGVLTHSIDLKMDMGYKRRYFETPEFKREERKFTAFRNQTFETVSYKLNDQKTELKVSSNIQSQIVVVSEKNEGKTSNRTDMIAAIDTMDWVNIFYLSGDVHPNNYSDEKPTVNNHQFEELLTSIKKNIA